MTNFFVQNFGCRATQADGAALEAELAGRGMTGCYAQRAPEELAGLPGVEWVVGNSHKVQIAGIVTGAPYHGQIHVGDIFACDDFLTAPVMESAAGRARPNLKIQDGCNNRCSFCVIPYVRGRSRYTRADTVIEQVRQLSGRYKEVVLSGINLGRWGRSPGSTMRLVDLLRRLLSETEIERIRLSSVEPMDFSDELLGLLAESPRMARHVHAPLQSGSDFILRQMHRKYRPRHYADRILKARSAMPDAAIGADVMVGFPGETNERFEESRRFIESLPFTYLHVFTYSERPGTRAVDMQGADMQGSDIQGVPMQVRRERNRVLRELGETKNLEFRRGMIGKRLSAVTLEQPGLALTDNYLKVELATTPAPNCIVDVEIDGLTDDGLREVKSPACLRATSTS